MFFKTFLTALATAGAVCMSTSAGAFDDFYLPYVQEQSVVGCLDDESFDRLLAQEPLHELASMCDDYLVSPEPVFTGWYFQDAPVWADGTDTFIGVRKYTMKQADGLMVRFTIPNLEIPTDGIVDFPAHGEPMDFHEEPPEVLGGQRILTASLE